MDRRFGVPVDPAYSPDYVHIRFFDIEPDPDTRSLKLTLESTDSHTSPDVRFVIKDHESQAVASATTSVWQTTLRCSSCISRPYSDQDLQSRSFVDIS